MPKGAEFGMEASQLSAPQGAGASPLEGVKTSSYTPDLAPVARLIESGASLFKQYKNAEADKEKSNILGTMMREIDAVNQAWDQKTISLDEADYRRRRIASKYASTYSSLREDIKGLLSVEREFGFSGVSHAKLDQERKQQEQTISDMQKVGIPASFNDSPEDFAKKKYAYFEALRLQNKIREERDTIEFQAKEQKWSNEEKQARLKSAGERTLSELTSVHYGVFTDSILSAVGKIRAGTYSEADRAQINKYYLDLRGMALSNKAVAPEATEAAINLIDTAWGGVKDLLQSGNGDINAVKNELERLVAATKLQAFKNDPDLLNTFVASDLFKNNPYVLNAATEPVTRFLGRAIGSDPANPNSGLEQIVGNPQREKQTLGTIRLMAPGAMKGNDKAKSEFNNIMGNLVEQYHDKFLANKLGSESRDEMFKLFSDPNVASYIRSANLPADTRYKLSDIYMKAYTSEFQNSMQKKLYEFIAPQDGSRVGLADTILQMRGTDPAKLGQKQIKDLVEISYGSMGLNIVPKNGTAMAKDAQGQLTKLQSTATNIINIGAAITGMEPKAFWDANRHLLLPGMGYPPPKEVVQQNSADAEALKRELKNPNLKPEQRSIIQSELDVASGKKGVPVDTNAAKRNQADIEELEKELAKVTSPAVRAILEGELKKKKGM